MIQYVVDYLYDIEKALDILKYIEDGEELRVLEVLSIKHIDDNNPDNTIRIFTDGVAPIVLQPGKDCTSMMKIAEIIDCLVYEYEYYFTNITVGRYTFSEALRNRERLFRAFDCEDYATFVSKSKIMLPLLININRDAIYSEEVLQQNYAAHVVPLASDDPESVYAAKYLDGVRESMRLTSKMISQHDRDEIVKRYQTAQASDIPKDIAYASGFRMMLKKSMDKLSRLSDGDK